MYSKVTARVILRALYDSERSGTSHLPDAQSLAQQLHVDLHDILDAFDILESDGYLTVYRVGGGGGGTTAQLTGRGKKIVLQANSSSSETKSPQPSRDVTIQPSNRSSEATIFISHIHEEARIALVLKRWMEKGFPIGCVVFVSSDPHDIPAGTKWFEKIDQSLSDAGLFIVLCSSESITRTWINFESGCAWKARVPILPICHSGSKFNTLPPPMSMFQGLDIADQRFAQNLFSALSKHLGKDYISSLDFVACQREIVEKVSQTPKLQVAGVPSATVPVGAICTPSSEASEDLAEEEVQILKTIADKGDPGYTSLAFSAILPIGKARLDYRMTELANRGFLGGNAFTTGGRIYHLTQKARQYLFSHNLL